MRGYRTVTRAWDDVAIHRSDHDTRDIEPGTAVWIESFPAAPEEIAQSLTNRGGSDGPDRPLPDGGHPAPSRASLVAVECRAVDASAEAYGILQTPDAVLGLGSHALTAVLTAAGGEDRARAQPWVPLALAAKVVVDAAAGDKLTVDQWTRHRAFCS